MKLTDAIISPIVAFALAFFAGLYGILKMIFTNRTKIEVLEAQLRGMDLVLKEVRQDQKDLFKEIKSLQK